MEGRWEVFHLKKQMNKPTTVSPVRKKENSLKKKKTTNVIR